MKFKILAVFMVLAGIGFSFASAQEPIVGCELGNSGVPCDFCQFFNLISRVINFLLFYAIPPLAVVAFLAAGLLFLFSGDDPNKRTKGRKVLWVTVFGILIAFAGWLIVNTILDQLVNKDAGIVWMPWNEIPRCEVEEGMEGPPPSIKPECDDGINNDDDSLIDFKEDGTGDPDCSSANDNTEKKDELELGEEKITPPCKADGESVKISNIIACMQKKIKGLPHPETNQIYGGSHTCNLNLNPQSVSCHYGGRNTENKECYGTSHAVDFGKNQATSVRKTLQQVKDSVESCAGVGSAYCEDSNGNRNQGCGGDANHVHVNDTDASDCGCK